MILLIGGLVQAAEYSHNAVLDRQGDYRLEWTPQKETIRFRVSVKTHGYVGLGFSPS